MNKNATEGTKTTEILENDILTKEAIMMPHLR